MKKSDLIESWLNSEITEDEAILLLERMKHDDSFNKELIESGEVHACLYTIFHEDTSFDELKLHEHAKSPDEIEDQIMHMISLGEPKEKSKKKRITVIDLPQYPNVKTKSFEQERNYWPLIGAVAAILAIVFTVALFSKKSPSDPVASEGEGSLQNEKIVLAKDKKRKENSLAKDKKPQLKPDKNELKPEVEKPVVGIKEIPQKESIIKSEDKTEQTLVSAEFLGKFLEVPEYCSLLRNNLEVEINEHTEIRAGDVLSTSYESKASVRLKDASLISLDPGTKVKFSSQQLSVYKGNAFFEISKQKNGHFQVFSGKTVTEVVGTKFSVSYEDTLSLVKVSSGTVKVKGEGQEVTLTKGQGAVARDGRQPQKREYSEQFGVLAAKWTAEQIGPQVGVLEFDVTDFITNAAYQDFYFKKLEDDSKGMLQIFKVELYENDHLVAVDEHSGVTSNHTTELRNRNVWLYGGYGSSMYRFYLKNFSADASYKIKVRCRSFKGSCPGEIWLLTTKPQSSTLLPGVQPEGRNLAYRKKTATENPGVSQNHGSEMIVDNKVTPQSSWWGAGSKWVQVDLGKETEINSIWVVNFWEQNCYHQYYVEVSRDGEKWQRVIDMTDSTLPAHESGELHRFGTTQARYVRMTVEGVKFSQGGISVVEMKVFKLK